MKTINEYTPTQREYFRLQILNKETNSEITTVKVNKNESLTSAISNIAQNLGYLRNEITYKFV